MQDEDETRVAAVAEGEPDREERAAAAAEGEPDREERAAAVAEGEPEARREQSVTGEKTARRRRRRRRREPVGGAQESPSSHAEEQGRRGAASPSGEDAPGASGEAEPSPGRNWPFLRILEEASGVRLTRGALVVGRVICEQDGVLTFDLGGRAVGIGSSAALSGSLGPGVPLGPGALLQVSVASVAESGHVALTSERVEYREVAGALERAAAAAELIEGIVFGFNRGGLDVLVAGVRLFCPAWKIGPGPADPRALLGRRLTFRVLPRRPHEGKPTLERRVTNTPAEGDGGGRDGARRGKGGRRGGLGTIADLLRARLLEEDKA